MEISEPKGVEFPEWLTENPEYEQVLIKAPSKFVVIDSYIDEQLGVQVIELEQMEALDPEAPFLFGDEPQAKAPNMQVGISTTDLMPDISVQVNGSDLDVQLLRPEPLETPD